MKYKSTVCRVGLLFPVLLRQAHTRPLCSRARRLRVGFWETNYWSKTITNLNLPTAPEDPVFSPSCPEEGAQIAPSTAEPRGV
jgi:hypothetical protein